MDYTIIISRRGMAQIHVMREVQRRKAKVEEGGLAGFVTIF
jgi:hypothetical protein